MIAGVEVQREAILVSIDVESLYTSIPIDRCSCPFFEGKISLYGISKLINFRTF